MNFLKSLLFRRSRRILLLAFVLLVTVAAYFQDAPFYLVNKNGTLTVQARYPIDGATLTNSNITFPGTIAGTGLQINGGTILTSQTGTGTSIVTNAGPSIAGVVGLNRLRFNGGTTLTNGAFAANSGWGTGPTITVAPNSTDALGSVSVTAGTSPAANPQLTLTFADGAWPATPACWANRSDVIAPLGTPIGVVGNATTSIGIVMWGTPVAASTYVFQWGCGARSA